MSFNLKTWTDRLKFTTSSSLREAPLYHDRYFDVDYNLIDPQYDVSSQF